MIFILIVTFFFVAILWLMIYYFRRDSLPGPRGWPLIGVANEILKADKQKQLNLLLSKWKDEFGSTYELRILNHRVIITADEAIIKRVLSSSEDFGVEKGLKEAFGLACKGLLILEGDIWRRHRKLASYAFVEKQLQVIPDITNRVLDALFAKWESQEVFGRTLVELKESISSISMDIIGLAAFNYFFDNVSTNNNPIMRAMDAISYGINARIMLPKFLWDILLNGKKELTAAVKYMREIITIILEERSSRPTSLNNAPNLMDLMISANEDGEYLTSEEIVDELFMFLLSGYDKIVNTLTWTIFMISQHRDVLLKIRREVDSVIGLKNIPKYSNIVKLKYLEWVIQETLRCYPVIVLTGRNIKKTVTINGHQFPPGTMVVTNFMSANMDPNIWPNPRKFLPERWESSNIPNFHFGNGPRSCIGEQFAMIELKAILVRLVQSYDFQLASSLEEVKPGISLTLCPITPIYVEFRRLLLEESN